MADPAMAYWMADFLLRQPIISNAQANHILLSLPFPTTTASAAPSPPSLRRAILLRRLSSDLSRRTLSLRTLSSLELLLSLNKPSHPDNNFLTAYLAVAVHLTATAPDFPSAVDLIFTRRVTDLLKWTESAGIDCARAREVVTEMELAVRDEQVRKRVMEKDSERKVIDSVRALVAREWEEVKKSKSFLEIAVELAFGGEAEEKSWKEAVDGERRRLVQTVDHSKETAATGEQPVGSNQLVHCSSKLDPMPTPEFEKLTNALKSSRAKLRELVRDPLPEAVATAGELLVTLCETTNVRGDGVTPDGREMEGPVSGKGKDVIPPCAGEGTSNAVHRWSLMDRNPTAHTYEWNDSIESGSESSQGLTKNTLHLASPKLNPVSPLTLNQSHYVRVANRRKKKKWTLLEEDTLRQAVKKHGKGNWKAMLNCYPNIFEDRTEVDLKDKWRNMTGR